VATLHKEVKSAKLRKYFDDEFPKINTNTTIWNAFLKWSGHQQDGKPSADDAKKAALQVIAKGATQQVNSMDTIVADPKNTANTDRSANGIFYTSDPDTVYMQAAIVEFYDANIDSTGIMTLRSSSSNLPVSTSSSISSTTSITRRSGDSQMTAAPKSRRWASHSRKRLTVKMSAAKDGCGWRP